MTDTYRLVDNREALLRLNRSSEKDRRQRGEDGHHKYHKMHMIDDHGEGIARVASLLYFSTDQAIEQGPTYPHTEHNHIRSYRRRV